ncbi:MAG: rhodanese-like domain-containing protein [Bacteroidota bacterium]
MKTIKSLVQEEGATVIDVRSSWEFADGHVDGALNIPLEEIPGRVAEIQALKQPLVVYCRSGNRSGMAQGFLAQAGLAEVYNGGGLSDMRIQLM